LPIKWFPRPIQAAILEQSFDLLGPGGCFLQLTNAFTSPLPGIGPGIAGEELERVWRNFLQRRSGPFAGGATPLSLIGARHEAGRPDGAAHNR
jgi:hypothetical protein